jgi:hypothetical protein
MLDSIESHECLEELKKDNLKKREKIEELEKENIKIMLQSQYEKANCMHIQANSHKLEQQKKTQEISFLKYQLSQNKTKQLKIDNPDESKNINKKRKSDWNGSTLTHK